MAGTDTGGRSRRIALVVACALALPAAVRAGGGADDAEIAERLIRASGVDAEIEAVGAAAAAWFGAVGPASRADRLALRAIVERGFAADTLERLAREDLLRRFDATHARAALRWLEQPRVRALLEAGRGAAGACDRPDEPAADPERAALAARVESATGVSLRSQRHASRVYAALLLAGNALLPETRRFTRVQLADMIADHDARLRRAPDPRASACRYGDFSTADLASAGTFLESGAGRWLQDAALAAVSDALDRAALATAQRIVETFGAPRPAPLQLVSARSPVGP